MKRGVQGAIWALPIAYALLLGSGADATAPFTFVVAFAVLGIDTSRWRRIVLRSLLYLGSLWIAAEGRYSILLPRLKESFTLLRHANFPAMTSAESVLLFVALIPLLVLFFEVCASMRWRLWQALLAFTLLAVLERLSVNVAPALVIFLALYFPVRYLDLVRARSPGWGGVALAATLFLAAVVLLEVSFTPILPAVASGKGPNVVQGYLVNPLSLDSAVHRSSAPQFFAAVSKPLYWSVYVGERYTGQGWKLLGSWQRMSPNAGTGKVPRDEKVVSEPLRLFANLPTDPVGGALVKVVSPRQHWSYRRGASAYRAQGSQITVLAAQPGVGHLGLSGPAAPPPRPADLFVPASVPQAVRSLAAQIVAGVGTSPAKEASAIVAFLQTRARYTLNVPSDAGKDFVYAFLFTSRAGDCNGFSSAFAILARLDGIPTRWVSGYLPGQRIQGGYLVTAKDAHSWDEIYLAGKGWVTIDPTPGFAAPTIYQLPSPPTSVSGALRGASRLAQLQQINATGNAAAGAATAGAGIPGWAFAAAAGAALLAFALYLRETLPLWWLRALAWIVGDPWPLGNTVRDWLQGRAPVLQAFLEWRLYRSQATAPADLAAVRRELRRLLRSPKQRRTWRWSA